MGTKKKLSIIIVFFLITSISFIFIVTSQPNNTSIKPNVSGKTINKESNNQTQNNEEEQFVKDTESISSYQIKIRGGFGVHFKIKCTEGQSYCEGDWKITTKGLTGKENIDEGCFTSGKNCPYSVCCRQNKLLFGQIKAEASIGNNYRARSGIILAGIILFLL